VEPRLEGIAGDLVVEDVRDGDDDAVEIPGRQQLAVVGVGPRDAEMAARGLEIRRARIRETHDVG
jgi:hypothetical protein